MKMFSRITSRFCIRQASWLIVLISLGQGAQANNVAQIPLSLTEGVPPNMILSIDGSGSMRWAFAPDNMAAFDNNTLLRNTRRVKSATFNPMYYDPSVTYQRPFLVNNDNQTERYTTSFTNAHINGFKPSWNWRRNLSNNYVVTWDNDLDGQNNYNFSSTVTYRTLGTINRLAENPVSDFDLSCSVRITSNRGNASCSNINGNSMISADLIRTR